MLGYHGTLLDFIGEKALPGALGAPRRVLVAQGGVRGYPRTLGDRYVRKAVRRPQAAVFAQLAEVVDGVADGFDVAIFA